MCIKVQDRLGDGLAILERLRPDIDLDDIIEVTAETVQLTAKLVAVSLMLAQLAAVSWLDAKEGL